MSEAERPDPSRIRPIRIALEGAVRRGHEVQLVQEDSRPFALIGKWAEGGAVVGSEPVRIATAAEDPFALLSGSDIGQETDTSTPDRPKGLFVGGGWFGHLGFQLGVPGEQHTPPPPSPERLPRFSLALYDHLLRLDRDGQWWFEALWTEEREEILRQRLETLKERLARGVISPGTFTTSPWLSDPSPQGHALAVEACRRRIAAGDLYQANVSLRLRSTLEGSAASLFSRAAETLRPDRAAFIGDGKDAIASLSPELFLERRGNRVRSAPIKGTRPRGGDATEAEASREELARSAKDRAENTMIVDLVRNDLGRVCEPGSVEVTALAQPKAHPGVWHLVSEIEGTLRHGISDAELLASTFPPGSVTGAPKLAAIETIAELESNARQAFTGAIGFASPYAGLELNVAIRTFEIQGERIWLDAGGGIVADSVPEEEAAEAATKAQPLLDAIGAVRAEPEPRSEAPAIRRLRPRPVPRPDPAEGVFETFQVSDGVPIGLKLHLARLEASVSRLYGEALPRDLASRIKADAAPLKGRLRFRIDYRPGLPIETTFAPLIEAGQPVTLSPVTIPGGLGEHKWRDRRLLDACSAATAPAVPLFVDLDGHALEVAWASLFIADADGRVATPRLDGRILPGVGRARLIEDMARAGRIVAERTVLLDEVREASRIFIANSLRGQLACELRDP